MTLVRAAGLDGLWEGELRPLCLQGRRVLLLRRGGEVFAYPDRCAHLGLPLSEGRLEGQVLTCKAHGWSYDVCTGHGVNPASARLPALRVELRAGEIWIDPGVPEAAS